MRLPDAPRADEACAQGLDPLTFRRIALDDGAGANLLGVAPLPRTHSYSSLDVYDRCPLRYAFSYVCRMPPREPRAHVILPGLMAVPPRQERRLTNPNPRAPRKGG